ncbi:MAG: peptidoglycan-associated lipoprotein Pal [Gammaproteobacteria bacterium]
MKTRSLSLLIFAVLLFGCESTPEKEEGVADVEDQGTSLGADDGTDDTGAEAYGTEEDTRSSISPLEDPQSPLSVRTIYFAYDSSDIQPEYRVTVEAHANYLASNPNVIVTLEGHADERGSREYNLALGERRAQAIKRQFTLLGASSGQIRTVSYGEERPAMEGHDESAWGTNRRVEIIY